MPLWSRMPECKPSTRNVSAGHILPWWYGDGVHPLQCHGNVGLLPELDKRDTLRRLPRRVQVPQYRRIARPMPPWLLFRSWTEVLPDMLVSHPPGILHSGHSFDKLPDMSRRLVLPERHGYAPAVCERHLLWTRAV